MCIPSFKILATIVPEKTVTQKNLTELRSYVITELRTDQSGTIIKKEQKKIKTHKNTEIKYQSSFIILQLFQNIPRRHERKKNLVYLMSYATA